MGIRNKSDWLPWISIGLLAFLCAWLGVLQYRWAAGIAQAQRASLQEQIQLRVTGAAEEINRNLETTVRALIPDDNLIDQKGWQQAWSSKAGQWLPAHPGLLRYAGVENRDMTPAFHVIDLKTGALTPAERPRGLPGEIALLVPSQWGGLFIFYFNDAAAEDLIARSLSSFRADADALGFDSEVVTTAQPTRLVFSSVPGAAIWTTSDASASLADFRNRGFLGNRRRTDGDRRGRDGGPGEFGGRRGPPRGGGGPGLREGFFDGRGPGGPPPFERAVWTLMARHKLGSLDAVVTLTHRRNLLVLLSVLLLIVGAFVLLIRSSRETKRLADLQMSFVTGVSHELRTPLTVIRTAAFNLSKPEAHLNEDRVARYSKLIESEAGKLEGLVDQVMRFASSKSGMASRRKDPLPIAAVIEAEIEGIRAVAESRGVTVEARISDNLPAVLGDRDALGQALRNLLDNGLKYGVETVAWLGVTAQPVRTGAGDAIEITVADRGPGIPLAEQRHIFDAFYRGKRALDAQTHGTGLGLNLVKNIVEAHGGKVTLECDSGGSRFTVQLPAASTQLAGADL